MILYAINSKEIYLYDDKKLELVNDSILKRFIGFCFTYDTEDFRKYAHTFGNYNIKVINMNKFTNNILPPNDFINFYHLLKATNIINEENQKYNQTAFASKLLFNISLYEKLLFNQLDKDIPHINQAYKGGRTEELMLHAKASDEEEIINYDINSAYAWALTQDLPDFTSEVVVYNLSIEDAVNLHKEGKFVIVDGEFYSNTYLPSIPIQVSTYKEEQTFFVNGKYRSITTNLDLRDVSGKIHKAWIYNLKEFPILKETILKTYHLRKESFQFYKDFLKMNLVMLYGLIAISKEGMQRNRLIGAYTTALVRNKHLEMLNTASQYGDLIYCDTDSIIVKVPKKNKEELSSKIGLGKELGQVGIRETYSEIKVYASKRYTFRTENSNNWKIKYAGVNLPQSAAFYNDTNNSLVVIRPFTQTEEEIKLSEADIPKRKQHEGNRTRAYDYDELMKIVKNSIPKALIRV